MATPNSAKQVTPADKWKELGKKRLGEVLELPSGLVVKVGHPHISDLIELGFIPGDLINQAMGFTEGDVREDTADDKRRMVTLITYIVAGALVQPRCLIDREPDYDKGEIHIRDLSDSDRLAIYNYAQGGARKLKKFRDESDGGSNQPNSKDIPRQPAEPAAGSK